MPKLTLIKAKSFLTCVCILKSFKTVNKAGSEHKARLKRL